MTPPSTSGPASPQGVDRGRAAALPARLLDRSSVPTLATLVSLAALAALSMNIFLPSLPGMATWYGVDYAAMQSSISLYMALSAALQLVIGPLADRFGRRPVLIVSLTGFLIASVGTLIAPTAEIFLICRMGQAVIAAAMVLSRTIVRDIVPAREAAAMIAYVTMAMSLVPMVGPVIGGWLDESFGWQANFALLLGAGIIVAILTFWDLGESLAHPQPSLGVQFRLYPKLLGSGRYWAFALSAALVSGCFFAYLGGAPYVGKEIFQLSSSQVGILFALPAAGYALGNLIAGRISTRVGIERMVLGGCLLTTGGLLAMLVLTLAIGSHPAVFFGLTLLLGIGNGLAMPNANAGMLSVRPDLAGSASGLGGAIMIGAGAALAALAGVLLGGGSSEMPLILLMTASGIASTLAIAPLLLRRKPI